jgi:hypothetical protein
MKRRSVVAGIAVGTFGLASAGPAQPANRVYRIGILGLRPTSDLVGPEPRSSTTTAFLNGMRELAMMDRFLIASSAPFLYRAGIRSPAADTRGLGATHECSIR